MGLPKRIKSHLASHVPERTVLVVRRWPIAILHCFKKKTKLRCVYFSSYRSHPCRISGVEPTILAKVASMGLPSSHFTSHCWLLQAPSHFPQSFLKHLIWVGFLSPSARGLGFPLDASIIFGIIPRFTPQSFVWERFIYTIGIAVTPPVICMGA